MMVTAWSIDNPLMLTQDTPDGASRVRQALALQAAARVVL